MANKTKLERMEYAELQMKDIPKEELIRMIKTGEKKLDRQFKQIENAGYELTQFQQTYLDRRENRIPLEQADTATLKTEASNIKRQLESDTSTLGGVRKISEKRLSYLFSDMIENEGITAKRMKKKKGEPIDIYRVGNMKITNEELSKFWKAVKEVSEEYNFLKIKGGSEDGIYEVRQYFFEDKITNTAEIMEKFKAKRESEDLEYEKLREEEKEVFSNVRKKGRVWKS